MKPIFAILALLIALGSTASFADTGKLVCVDDLKSDGNTIGGLDYAITKLNTKLSKIQAKSISTPVILPLNAGMSEVCVTVMLQN